MYKYLRIWRKKWNKTFEWNLPIAKWLIDGKLNTSENCLDRHLSNDNSDKIALVWEGEPIEADGKNPIRKISYRQLHGEVCRFANASKYLGIKRRQGNNLYANGY